MQKMSPFFKLVRTKNLQEPDFKHLFDALLASGHVEIDSPDQFGASAFWYLFTNNRQEEAFYLAETHHANINHIDNYGIFALKRELYNNNLPLMTRLLDKGKANANMIDEFERTVLHLSCDYSNRRDYSDVFRLLTKHSANLSQLDFKQRTPLHYMFVKRNKRHEIDHFDPLRNNISKLDILLNE